MKDLKSRVAYLQGLSAGLDLNDGSREGKLLHGIIEVLDEFAETVQGLEEAQDQLEDYIETIDEDLYRLEDEFFDDDDEGDCLEGEYLEAECPRCGETVCFDSGILEDDDLIEVTCPNCDEVVFVNDETLEAAGGPGSLENRAGYAAVPAGRVEEEDI
ncbi:MAG: AraC family transcriptional regulator [Firmicutes bacterium]|nr:AraC family transcriptional regulator [Bacillota bacterium]